MTTPSNATPTAADIDRQSDAPRAIDVTLEAAEDLSNCQFRAVASAEIAPDGRCEDDPSYREGTVLDVSFVADEDLSEHRFGAVTCGLEAYSVMRCGLSDMPIGILQNNPRSGEVATVRVLGTSSALIKGPAMRSNRLGPSGDGPELVVLKRFDRHCLAICLCDEEASRGSSLAQVAITSPFAVPMPVAALVEGRAPDAL